MADDLSLLLKLRGDNAGAKAALADTRAAIAALRASAGSDLNQIQAASSKALGSVQASVTNLARSVPGGNVFVSIAEGLRGVSSQSDKAGPALKKFNSTVEELSRTTGKSHGELVQFLSTFVKLPNAFERSVDGYVKFGSKFDDLRPQLEAAGKEMAAVSEKATAMGSSFAAVAGPVGIAVLAIGAMVAGAALLVKELFSLAEGAADFRGKLFDLSQQTGISVETLSALEIVAKTTGGSLEGITASLGIFQKNLESAQDPTSKQAKLLKELGVETDNTEEALRQTLTALAAMPEGFQQTARALELFGRGGKSVLAILKETQGDLDGTIEKLREMGLIVSREDAEAADKFNDQLAILGFQFRALLGKEVIPAALSALEDVSRTLKENQDAVHALGQALGALASVVGLFIKGNLVAFTVLWAQHKAEIEAVAAVYERIVSALRAVNILSKETAGGGQAITQSFPERVGGGEIDTNEHQPLSEREKENAEKAKKAAAEALSEAKKAAAERKRDLEGQLSFFAGLNKELGEAADAYSGLDIKTRVYAVAQSIANGELKNAALGLQEIALGTAADIDKIEKDIALQKELKEWRDKQNEAVRLALDGEKSSMEQAEEFIEKMRARGQALEVATEFWIRFNAAILDSKRALDMYADSLERVQVLKNAENVPERLTEDQMSQVAGAAANAQTTEEASAADAAAAANERHAATVETLRGAYEGLAGSIAQGIGSMVQNFVLLGKTGPDAFRKVTAAALASLAARAAADAIYELAIGLAALTPWGAAIYGPAFLHFQAAALLGSIAAVAAVAGRAVAGNSFADKSTASGAGGSQGGSNGTAARPSTVETNRNDYRPVIQVHLHGEAAVAFNYKVVDAVVDDHRLNGRVRVLTEGGSV